MGGGRVALAGLLVLGAALVVEAGPAPPPPPPAGQTGGPVPGLSSADRDRWLQGRAEFDRDFSNADGLGAPDFNADSCRACHRDPVLGGSGGLELNVSRFGLDHGGAGPFEDLPGGQVLQKLRPPPLGTREEYPVGTADVFEQRQPPPLFGLGRIAHIPDAEILANEDPSDLDGDGVAGRARRVMVAGQEEIGRYGWKAQIPRIDDFVRDALGTECGITTADVGRGFGLRTDADLAPDPEIDETRVGDLGFFLRNLAPPPRTGSQDPAVAQGEALFTSVGCAKCHVPSLLDDQGVPVRLYSDLLLHRVMGAGFRGMAEPGAEAGVYRTPPLWGVASTAPYLHDGRAETLAEAIALHDGEALAVRNAYTALSPAERDALIRFLEDL